MVIISVDLGQKRTGIAACDRDEILCSPVCVVRNEAHKVVLDKVLEVCAQRGAEAIVVGMPCNMDGTESERTVVTKSFVRKLKGRTKLAVHTIDERLTTVEAEELWGKTRLGKPRSDIDALSAVIILEDYLNSR
jgi:RNAse H-fold protein YqgF